MKHPPIQTVEAGEPLIRQALESVLKTHDAESSDLPVDVMRRRKFLANSVCQVVIDVPLARVSVPPSSIH